MDTCPRCGQGLEWGKDWEGETIIYFWRCCWCGWKGDEITRIEQ